VPYHVAVLFRDIMTRRSGSADLPLHHGRVPSWLGERMTRLGAVVTEAIVHHYGRDEFLRRMAHPFWFQSFGAVMGMDWHSSGITTSVLGALKRGLAPLAGELGLHVCGGRGRHSRRSEGVTSFVEAPHAAIDGRNAGEIVNLTDRRAAASRAGQLELLHDLGPDRIVREAALLAGDRMPVSVQTLPHLVMPAHHDVRPKDVMLRRLYGALAAAADRGPSDFAELLLVPGIGERTVRSLAMVAKVIHGAPCRFADPARHSLAHGGKDRQPFPVPTVVYDQTIAVLKDAVGRAKLGRDDRLHAIRRLDVEARRLERTASGPAFHDDVEEERRRSPEYGGRSVFGWEGLEQGEPADGAGAPAGRCPACSRPRTDCGRARAGSCCGAGRAAGQSR
jgi:hypothetical protein